MAKSDGKKSGGRAKGTPNKRTQELIEIAGDLDCNPFEILCMIAMNDWEGLGYHDGEVQKESKQGHTFYEERIKLEHRLAAAREAAQYLYPKRKAIEIQGKVEKIERAATVKELREAIEVDAFIEIPAASEGKGRSKGGKSGGKSDRGIERRSESGGDGTGEGTQTPSSGGSLGSESARAGSESVPRGTGAERAEEGADQGGGAA